MMEERHIESGIERAVSQLDFDRTQATYWKQSEFIVLPRALDEGLIRRLVHEVESAQDGVRRSLVPGFKKSGSISHFTLMERAPEILALYRSPALISFLSELADARLVISPADDPHGCAIYQYTRPGDRVGFHYDTSFYRGARYTVLVGLVNRSTSRLVCTLHKGDRHRAVRELHVATDPGTVVIFNGDKLWHAVSPLGQGEQRIVLTLQYLTRQDMHPVGRFISNMKDAVGYFGFRELMVGRRRRPQLPPRREPALMQRAG
jgi:hypothetical protein